MATQSLTPNQEKWLLALESGKYKQGREWLCKGDAYCCLGIWLALKKVPFIKGTLVKQFFSKKTGEESKTCLLEENVKSLGLNNPYGRILPTHKILFHKTLRKYGYKNKICVSLAEYNDEGATFAQIAAACRECPQAVFQTMPKHLNHQNL